MGRAVASDTGGLRFESSHQLFLRISAVLKRRKYRKRDREWPKAQWIVLAYLPANPGSNPKQTIYTFI